MNTTDQSGSQAGRYGQLDPLTPEEARVLECEETWARRGLRKNLAIAELGMTVSHYYLVLNRAIAKPIAALENPEWCERVIGEHGDRIGIAIDVKGSRLAARGCDGAI